jgi:adenylate cyclase
LFNLLARSTAYRTAMSEQQRPPSGPSDDFWRGYLTAGTGPEHALRRLFRFIPANPRCSACAAPFAGIGAPAMRLIGKRRSDSNPKLCNSCFAYMRKHRGGAEIECTLLFADVRGSTALAEQMSPKAFQELLGRFYRVATHQVFDHDGSVDKFVGDEVVAMFFPLASGPDHPGKAIEAARAILRETGHGAPEGPWLPVGAGVHTGEAWVGALGDDAYVEMTALGDAVNVAARLASLAGAGEILVSSATATRAGVKTVDTDERLLELKGRSEPLPTVVIRERGTAWRRD